MHNSEKQLSDEPVCISKRNLKNMFLIDKCNYIAHYFLTSEKKKNWEPMYSIAEANKQSRGDRLHTSPIKNIYRKLKHDPFDIFKPASLEMH